MEQEIEEAFSGIDARDGKSWRELANDPDWNPEDDSIDFPSHDSSVCQYYLPAWMVRSLRNPLESLLAWRLTNRAFRTDMPQVIDWNESFQDTWAALDDRQRQCVKHFLEHMLAVCQARHEAIHEGFDPKLISPVVKQMALEPWQTAYLSYWRDVPST